MYSETAGKPTVLRNAPVPLNLDELLKASMPKVGIVNTSSTEKRPPPEMDGGGAIQGSVGGTTYGVRSFLHYCWGAYDVLSNVYFAHLGRSHIIPKLHVLRNRWDHYSILYKEVLEKVGSTEDNRFTLGDVLFINRCWIRTILLHEKMRGCNDEFKESQQRLRRHLPQIYAMRLLQFDASTLHPMSYTVSQLVDSVEGIAMRWCEIPDGPEVRCVVEQLLNRTAILITSVFSGKVFDVSYFRSEAQKTKELTWYNANAELITFLQARLDGMLFAFYSYSLFPRLRSRLQPHRLHDTFGSCIETKKELEKELVVELRKRRRNRRRRKNKRGLQASRPTAPPNPYADPTPTQDAVGIEARLPHSQQLDELFRDSASSECESSDSEGEEDDEYGAERQLLGKERFLTTPDSWSRYRKWLMSLVKNMQGERGDSSLRIRCLECWVWPGERKLWERRNKGEVCKKIEVVSACITAPRVTTTQNLLRYLLSPQGAEKGLLDEERGYNWGVTGAGTVWRDMLVLRAVCGYFRVKFRKSWGDHFLLLQEDFGRCIDALGISHNYPMLVQNGAGEGFDCWYQKQYVHCQCAEKAFYFWLYFIWRDFQGKVFNSIVLDDLLERLFGKPYYGAKDLADMEIDNSRVLWQGSAASKQSTFIKAVL